MFQVPAFSIGTTMSYSVIGLPFYKDGETSKTSADDGGSTSGGEAPAPAGAGNLIPDPQMTMTEDQVTWFGMLSSLFPIERQPITPPSLSLSLSCETPHR